MFHAIVLSFITLTAHRAPVKLPAITIEGAIRCDGERLPLTDPFTGRDAWYCQIAPVVSCAASTERYSVRDPFDGRHVYFCAAIVK